MILPQIHVPLPKGEGARRAGEGQCYYGSPEAGLCFRGPSSAASRHLLPQGEGQGVL